MDKARSLGTAVLYRPTIWRRSTQSLHHFKPPISDADLVLSILDGSRDHFDLLYDVYFPCVYGYALKRLREPADAEDVAQDVFVAVLSALHTYRGTAPLRHWILGITRHTVNRRFRSVRPKIDSLDASDAQQIAGDNVPIDRVVDARRMIRHCGDLVESELSPLQRHIFHLKHFRRHSAGSIARALGKSEGAIKTNLHRIRRAIATNMPDLASVLRI
jgi:RNA polymerase sigma-70 factor, ECF subfamily